MNIFLGDLIQFFFNQNLASYDFLNLNNFRSLLTLKQKNAFLEPGDFTKLNDFSEIVSVRQK